MDTFKVDCGLKIDVVGYVVVSYLGLLHAIDIILDDVPWRKTIPFTTHGLLEGLQSDINYPTNLLTWDKRL